MFELVAKMTTETFSIKIRKELNRWSRKLLLCIGLESIGKELVGEEKWTDRYPFSQQSLLTSDFKTENSSSRDRNKFFEQIEINQNDDEESDYKSENDDEPIRKTSDPNVLNIMPYWYFMSRALSMGKNDSSLEPNFNNLLLLYNLKQHQILEGENNNIPHFSLASTLGSEHSQMETEQDDVQPLDLTQKSKRSEIENTASTNLLRKRIEKTGRGYTSEELEKALNDIQSGRLGTRRAAVIYGIPRSTLRNKVYKLEKDRGGSTDVNELKEEKMSTEKRALKHWLQTKIGSRTNKRGDNEISSESEEIVAKSDDEKVRDSEVLETDLESKKSRPKRGKYRNYEKEALVNAVSAVQNGEMSVHRAGSYFGVPHSTLEYKVKERHLLRQPKKRKSVNPQDLSQKIELE